MKFKFCSDGDCPLWALAALHAVSTLPAPLFRTLVRAVVEGSNDDAIMDLLKDTNLSSRDECARAVAVIRWTLKSAWSSACPGSQLSRDLLMLGVPRTHAVSLSEAADEARSNYEKNAEENCFMINKVSDVSISSGPEGSTDALKISLQVDNVFSGDQTTKEFLLPKVLRETLLSELRTAYMKMEEIDQELKKTVIEN